jgi:hypothetical protein
MAAIDPGLDELLRDYTEGRAGCGYECSAMHLGALVQDLHRLNLIERTPTPRLQGLSLVELVERLRDMRVPIWYQEVLPDWHGIKKEEDFRLHDCPARIHKGKVVGEDAFKLGLGEKKSRVHRLGPSHGFVGVLIQEMKDKIEQELQLRSFV